VDTIEPLSQGIGATSAKIIEMTKKLVDTGYAYASDGNVWFDVIKDEDYGKLSNRKVEQQESGTRSLEGRRKRNAADFALWKAAKPGEPKMGFAVGRGTPRLAHRVLRHEREVPRETFDIHGGGMDLMFPHHENELAQSESATGKQFAKYWLHNGLTRMPTKLPGGQIKMEKQSKSLGNTIDARKLIEDNGPDLVRYLLIGTHYRSPIDFTDQTMANVKKALMVFTRLFERIERLGKKA